MTGCCHHVVALADDITVDEAVEGIREGFDWWDWPAIGRNERTGILLVTSYAGDDARGVARMLHQFGSVVSLGDHQTAVAHFESMVRLRDTAKEYA